jgi:hypothetical protein
VVEVCVDDGEGGEVVADRWGDGASGALVVGECCQSGVEEICCVDVDWVIASGGCDCVVESVCGEEVGEGYWWVEEVNVEVSLDSDRGVGGGGGDVVDELLETVIEEVEVFTFGPAVDVDYGVLGVVLVLVGVELGGECLGVVDGVVGSGKDGGVEGIAGVDGDIGAVVDVVAGEREAVGAGVGGEVVLGERDDVWAVVEVGEVFHEEVIVALEGADVGVVEAEGAFGVAFVVEFNEPTIELCL